MIFTYIIPITMLLLSPFCYIKADGKISDLSGFRTALSKQSKDNWRHAHRYISKAFLIAGAVLLLANIIITTSIKITEGRSIFIAVFQSIVYIIIGGMAELNLKKYVRKKELDKKKR